MELWEVVAVVCPVNIMKTLDFIETVKALNTEGRFTPDLLRRLNNWLIGEGVMTEREPSLVEAFGSAVVLEIAAFQQALTGRTLREVEEVGMFTEHDSRLVERLRPFARKFLQTIFEGWLQCPQEGGSNE